MFGLVVCNFSFVVNVGVVEYVFVVVWLRVLFFLIGILFCDFFGYVLGL